jgi:heme exporter protein C
VGELSIDPSMAYPLLVMIAGFYGLYSWLLMHWVRADILQSESKTSWVKELVAAK